MKKSVVLTLIYALVFAVTALCFYLLRPQECTELFYVNVALTFVLEILLGIGMYVVLDKKNIVTPQRYAVAKTINGYVIFMAVVMLAFIYPNMTWHIERYYYVALLVVTLIGGVRIILVTAAAKHQLAVVEENHNGLSFRKQVVQEYQYLDMLCSSFAGNSVLTPRADAIAKQVHDLTSSVSLLKQSAFRDNSAAMLIDFAHDLSVTLNGLSEVKTDTDADTLIATLKMQIKTVNSHIHNLNLS